MGVDVSRLRDCSQPRRRREPEATPTGYCVHGLHYWAGKMIPYNRWPSAILNPTTGVTYDEMTIFKGGAKSKRARIIARFQRLIESYSDEDLSNPNSTKSRIINRLQKFIDSQSDGHDIKLDDVVTECRRCRHQRRKRATSSSSSSSHAAASASAATAAERKSRCKRCSCKLSSIEVVDADSEDDESPPPSPLTPGTTATANANLTASGGALNATSPVAIDLNDASSSVIEPPALIASHDVIPPGASSLSAPVASLLEHNNNTCTANTARVGGADTAVSMESVPEEERWKHAHYPFENLVFSGGGMKGYSYIGAVKVRTSVLVHRCCEGTYMYAATRTSVLLRYVRVRRYSYIGAVKVRTRTSLLVHRCCYGTYVATRTSVLLRYVRRYSYIGAVKVRTSLLVHRCC